MPWYTGCIGFSGVGYALKVVANHTLPSHTLVHVQAVPMIAGLTVRVPVRFAVWAQLALSQLLSAVVAVAAGGGNAALASLGSFAPVRVCLFHFRSDGEDARVFVMRDT